jgi:hypothetical protein
MCFRQAGRSLYAETPAAGESKFFIFLAQLSAIERNQAQLRATGSDGLQSRKVAAAARRCSFTAKRRDASSTVQTGRREQKDGSRTFFRPDFSGCRFISKFSVGYIHLY